MARPRLRPPAVDPVELLFGAMRDVLNEHYQIKVQGSDFIVRDARGHGFIIPIPRRGKRVDPQYLGQLIWHAYIKKYPELGRW